MSPEEKAEWLIKKMLSKNPCIQDGISIIDSIQAKQCALIAVDEIIKSNPNDPYPGGYYETEQDRINNCIWYWNEVKNEINKL
jgi:hypothetical protein